MKSGTTILKPGTDRTEEVRNSFTGLEALEDFNCNIRELGKLTHVGHTGGESSNIFFYCPGAALEARSSTLTLATTALDRSCDSGKMAMEKNKRNRCKNKPAR
jgi:hypothetical protein